MNCWKMSKRALWLSVALLVCSLALFGCSSSEKASTPAESGTDTVRIATVREETPRYKIDVQYPQFGITGDAAIKQAIDDAVRGIKDLARDYPPPGGLQYTLTSSLGAVYTDSTLVSVQVTLSSYTGGAHGGSAIYGFNFERRSGRQLNTDDALSLIGLPLSQVAEQTAAQLRGRLGSAFFPEGAKADAKNYYTFLVGADRVTFVFQEYQVAPYAEGPQEVWFPRKAH